MTYAPTIAELLADPLFDAVELVAGAVGGRRVVEDLYLYDGSSEGIAGALLVCDEADVTPAFKLDALVRRAEAADAAAVLVLAGGARPLLSGIRLADRLGIPVLWLASQDRFRFALDVAILLRAPHVDRAETLLRIVADIGTRADAATVMERLSRTMSLPVSLLSPDGRAIIGPSVDTSDLRLDIMVSQSSADLIVQPVMVEDRVSAWIACAAAGQSSSKRATVAAALSLAEPYVRAWLISEAARADLDAHLLARLLNDIMAARDAVGRDVAEQAVAVGWRLDGWHIGAHVTCDGPRAPADGGIVTRALRDALADVGVTLNGVAEHSGGWAMWSNPDADSSENDVRRMIRGFRQATSILPRDWGLVVGIGRPHHGVGGLADTITEARNAGYLARSREFRPSVDHADELGVAKLLATLQQSEVARAFAETALAPISDPANEHLFATLRTYLQNGGSVLLTAQSLAVHRNTVTARLQQLQERLGVDLDDPSQLLALQMAVRAIRT